jgi:hypothetical protein
MAVALSSAEMVLQATDTKTNSRSATSAAAMSNNPVSLNHLISERMRQNSQLSKRPLDLFCSQYMHNLTSR